jgi:Uma2 family endonuclease
MILTEELFAATGGRRATITPDMPSPKLVVEVVLPGKTNEDRDYRYKRSEYAARRIPEYWIVDPVQAQVTILTLVDGLYEAVVCQGSDRMASTLFPDWPLTAAQFLSAGQAG